MIDFLYTIFVSILLLIGIGIGTAVAACVWFGIAMAVRECWCDEIKKDTRLTAKMKL